jgi:hypothetical protein
LDLSKLSVAGSSTVEERNFVGFTFLICEMGIILLKLSGATDAHDTIIVNSLFKYLLLEMLLSSFLCILFYEQILKWIYFSLFLFLPLSSSYPLD